LAPCGCCCADEWEQSIVESHPHSTETDAALATHRKEVEHIRAALRKHDKPIRQLLAASQALARANDAAAPGQGPSEPELQHALEVLRQAAAHVSWF